MRTRYDSGAAAVAVTTATMTAVVVVQALKYRCSIINKALGIMVCIIGLLAYLIL